jgi:YD repeat-containing protein
MYSTVAVREAIKYPDGTIKFMPTYSVFDFLNFNDEMVKIQPQYFGGETEVVSEFGNNHIVSNTLPFPVRRIKRKHLTLTNTTAILGAMKKVTLMTVDGQKISETINDYLHEDLNNESYSQKLASRFNSIGVVEETYTDARMIRLGKETDMSFYIIGEGWRNDKPYVILTLVSHRKTLPLIQLGSQTINYKTGITTRSRNLAFDFYSGQVTVAYSEDAYGNKFVSKQVPAYRMMSAGGQKAYPGMGLMTENKAYKNMLTQEGATYAYQLSPDFDVKVDNYQDHIVAVVGASVQTWSDQNDVMHNNALVNSQTYPQYIYRKKAAYGFIGDNVHLNGEGQYLYSQFSEATLEANNTINDPRWQKTGEITLYDVFSHALEAKDINGNYAATKLDAKNEMVYATAANARYNEFCYAGAEDTPNGVKLGGNVTLHGTRTAGTDQAPAHTGKYYVKTTGATQALSFTGIADKSRKYRVMFWTTNPQAVVKLTQNGLTLPEPGQVLGTVNGWHLVESVFNIDAGTFTVALEGVPGQEVRFDDFRVCPVDGAMTSYVYNQWGELSHVLDANNLYTEYKYDGMGRLKSVTRETLQHGPVKTSEINIYYANQN